MVGARAADAVLELLRREPRVSRARDPMARRLRCGAMCARGGDTRERCLASLPPSGVPSMACPSPRLLDVFVSLVVLLLSLTVHEAAHAWTADRLGDSDRAAPGPHLAQSAGAHRPDRHGAAAAGGRRHRRAADRLGQAGAGGHPAPAATRGAISCWWPRPVRPATSCWPSLAAIVPAARARAAMRRAASRWRARSRHSPWRLCRSICCWPSST